MNASKENARQAFEYLEQLGITTKTVGGNFITEFLAAAERRLPGEEAIARDKARKARYRKSSKPARAEPS